MVWGFFIFWELTVTRRRIQSPNQLFYSEFCGKPNGEILDFLPAKVVLVF
jgi:hypothetical protein